MKYQLKLLSYVCIGVLLINTSYAKQATALFSLDPAIKSSAEAMIPISSSVKEWSIVFDASLVSENTTTFEIALPSKKNNEDDSEIFSVVRTSYRRYDSGNTQWAGDIFSNPGKTAAGFIIVNMIDSQPFAVIGLNNNRYEIYYDSNVGNRLAKIQGTPHINDVVSTTNTKDYIESAPTKISNNISSNTYSSINGTSVVDVLVVIDDDLNFPGSPIFSRIQTEKMNADLILSTSGLDGVGVPLILNLLPIETINIPSNLEEITVPCPGGGSCIAVSEAFNSLTDGSLPTSQELINRRDMANADIIALYIPFDPALYNPGDENLDVCGFARVPLSTSDDAIFAMSFSLHASNCTTTQFVFLHEIMHSFGARHSSSNSAFKPHARGIVVPNPPGENMATLLGCYNNDDPLPFDPGATDCNRIPQLSSPLVTVNGQLIGRVVPGNPNSPFNSDNVRFLTECNLPNDCRRDQLANRRNGSSPVDLMPTIAILTPVTGEVLQATDSFALTALVSDDNSIDTDAVNWTVTNTDNGQVITGVGTGNDFSFVTSAFATAGEYIVSASVEDSIGQISIDTNTVVVEANQNIVPILYLLMF